MNAPLISSRLARLLLRNYSHDGLSLDLHGHIEEDGYRVTLVTVPGSMTSVGADDDLMDRMSASLDDTSPTSEQLRRESRLQARIDRSSDERQARRRTLL